jgi:hypothetical protein
VSARLIGNQQQVFNVTAGDDVKDLPRQLAQLASS